MLEKVREAALVPFFILGTDVVPEIYGNKWKLVLPPYDHVETVVKCDFGQGEVEWEIEIDHRAQLPKWMSKRELRSHWS
jgi:hypothetical protein